VPSKFLYEQRYFPEPQRIKPRATKPSPYQRPDKWWEYGFLLVAAAFVLCLVAGAGYSALRSATSHTVVYQITGTTNAAAIYYTRDDATSTSTQTDAIPWSVTLNMRGNPYIEAQVVPGPAARITQVTLTCSIIVDGRTVDRRTATGIGVAVVCAGG
jgi:hypothetical protein